MPAAGPAPVSAAAAEDAPVEVCRSSFPPEFFFLISDLMCVGETQGENSVQRQAGVFRNSCEAEGYSGGEGHGSKLDSH